MANGIFDEQDEIRNENAEHAGDLAIQIDAQIARIDTALAAALNMTEIDGGPPDWDYLRLVRSQLPGFRDLLIHIKFED